MSEIRQKVRINKMTEEEFWDKFHQKHNPRYYYDKKKAKKKKSKAKKKR